MIYLFTGNMGTGKTSRVVAMILDNEDNLFKMTLDDGTVSTHSRPKAAGKAAAVFTRADIVSTHSRPKAAG